MHTSDSKRLFFGIEVRSPWPEELPKGRLLDPMHRHMTLAFLGNVPSTPLLEQLPALPPPPFHLAPVGFFDVCLFLPPCHPNVVAWHVNWIPSEPLLDYQQTLSRFLLDHAYSLDERAFLPHVTLARWPFDQAAWEKQPFKLPVMGTALHLYESVGNLTYTPLWSLPFLLPFESFSHTADIAFKVRGSDLHQLYVHAQMALAFEHPALLDYLDTSAPSDHDSLIAQLNSILGHADSDVGVPFKAVSYHGLALQQGTYLEWEMIVDV